MNADDQIAAIWAWMFFWLVIGGAVGAAIGNSKKQAPAGLLLGALLGPIGWLVTAFLPDERRKCPRCQSGIPDDAKICPRCRTDFSKRPDPTPPEAYRRPEAPAVVHPPARSEYSQWLQDCKLADELGVPRPPQPPMPGQETASRPHRARSDTQPIPLGAPKPGEGGRPPLQS